MPLHSTPLPCQGPARARRRRRRLKTQSTIHIPQLTIASTTITIAITIVICQSPHPPYPQYLPPPPSPSPSPAQPDQQLPTYLPNQPFRTNPKRFLSFHYALVLPSLSKNPFYFPFSAFHFPHQLGGDAIRGEAYHILYWWGWFLA